MITRLNKLTTDISIIQEIPKMFFREIENSAAFGNHLFPVWTNSVFGATSMNDKFEAVYNKYKKIKSKTSRDKIVSAFTHNNQIENLCANKSGSLIVKLTDLPKRIQNELDTLFLHLYNSAINYHLFEVHVSDTLKNAIERFVTTNGIVVCPFCGIEGFLTIEGQSRLALDHWLCKDLFPMASVNFDNLFPIGSKCNERPAKGTKNILIDNPKDNKRIEAFYPYIAHKGILTDFKFINEPTISGITDTDWSYSMEPADSAEQNIFDSWESTMNISIRYLDYHRKIIFNMWEDDYKRFIEEDHDIKHAQTIDELKNNFRIWKASFPIKGRPGAILYRSFIDNLVNNASNSYLYGLCENFKR